MNRTRILAASALLAFTVLTSGSSAFAADWAFNSSGSNARFTWSQGQHVEGYPDVTAHGSPVVTVDGFFFNNTYGDMSFRAEAGSKETVQSSVYVYLSANGAPIDQVIVREYGTWGGNPALLGVQADFLVFDWMEFTDTHIDLPTVTFNPDGTWVTQYTYYPNPTLTEFDISVVNIVSAIGGAGFVPPPFIEKTGLEIIVPEPSTLLLLVAVAPLLVKRNRR
jgi:hypothetical protein